MIQIEIISTTGSNVKAAFYYEVPDNVYSPLSVNTARQPAGTALDTTEIGMFKQGRLYEVVKTGDAAGRSMTEIQDALLTMWDNGKNAAKQEYVSRYSYVGTVYRDGTWQ